MLKKVIFNGYSILIPGKTHSEKTVVKSTEFAKVLDAHLKKSIRIRSEGIKARDDLTGFNWSETPVVLLEMGYMSNKKDDEMMATKDYKKAVVQAIADALEEYFK